MDNEVSILDEFIVKKNKPRLLAIITALAFVFLALLFWELASSFSKINPSTFHLQMALLFFLFPAAGLLFHITGKRIGWVLNIFYYTFLTIITGYAFILSLQRPSYASPEAFNWRLLITFLLTLALTVLLCLHKVRKFFNIQALLLITCLAITTTLALLLIFLVLKG
jgi:hypothetical protein